MSSTPTHLLAATFGAALEGLLIQTDRAVMANSIRCLRRFRLSSRMVRDVPDDFVNVSAAATRKEPSVILFVWAYRILHLATLRLAWRMAALADR